MTKHDLKSAIVEALRHNGGRGSVVDVCREIWSRHQTQLAHSGDLFYTWQYDVRWAAHLLRQDGVLKRVEDSRRGVWELA